MKIRPLFEKYQKYLLAFANTRYGRMYLSLEKWGKIKNNFPIVKLTPDSVHFWTGEFKNKKPIIQAVFFSRSPYLKKFRLALEGLEIARGLIGKVYNPELVVPHFQGLTNVAWLPLLMRDTDTFYPDADPESTSVDGFAARASVNETWTTIREGAGNHSADDGLDNLNAVIWTSNTTNQWSNFYRGIALFDTSSLGNNVVIVSATFSIWSQQKENGISDFSVEVCSSNPASNTSIVDADYLYTNFGTTSFGSLSYSDISTTAYNDISLNTSGKNNISKTGISKFGIRESHDLNDSAPTWSSGARNMAEFYEANTSDKKPKLVVTYTLPSGDLFFVM